jgi:hypothetical protein
MGGVVTEKQAISHAHYLDLIYSQTSTLYDLILMLLVRLQILPQHLQYIPMLLMA